MDAITLEHVSKRFRPQQERELKIKELVLAPFRARPELWALRDVSVSVPEASSLGVIGPNGAGKTTLMRLVLGVTRPTKGRVLTCGRVVGLLDLYGGLHRDLTGMENVYYFGAFLGLSRRDIRARLSAITDFAECHKFPRMLETPARYYSAGMSARLTFSVAMHAEPQVLVVDEVLAVGDIGFQQKCFDKLRALKSQGVAIVLVSHQLEQVSEFCARAVWLEEGRVVREGPAREIVRSFTHTHTAAARA